MQRRLALIGGACFSLILLTFASVPHTSPPPRVVSPEPIPLPEPTPAWAVSGTSLDAPRADRPLGTRVRPRAGPFRIPIAGASLPAEPGLLPGSARSYRGGSHEGVDFAADAGTPVVAAAAGFVIRADVIFSDWDAAAREAALAEAVALGHTPERILDRIRGRQVWLDHGDGVVTRYAHLQDVAVVRGRYVFAGETIGTVGSSGYPEGGPHLHFEIRIGDGFYRDDLGPEAQHVALERVLVTAP